MAKGTQDFTPDSRNEAILINVNGVLKPRAEAVVSACLERNARGHP